jgi:hypothetical protein
MPRLTSARVSVLLLLLVAAMFAAQSFAASPRRLHLPLITNGPADAPPAPLITTQPGVIVRSHELITAAPGAYAVSGSIANMLPIDVRGVTITGHFYGGAGDVSALAEPVALGTATTTTGPTGAGSTGAFSLDFTSEEPVTAYDLDVTYSVWWGHPTSRMISVRPIIEPVASDTGGSLTIDLTVYNETQHTFTDVAFLVRGSSDAFGGIAWTRLVAITGTFRPGDARRYTVELMDLPPWNGVGMIPQVRIVEPTPTPTPTATTTPTP